MKKISLFLILAAIAVNSVSARNITVSVGAGKNWKAAHTAQFAVWLEDTDGNYLQTLYVTRKASKRTWIFCPKAGRPESLPVWYNASRHEVTKSKVENKTDKSLKIDAVTRATPKGGVVFNAEITDKNCVIKAEFNTSFDYNDFYTKKNSNDNGQPSVIYEALIPENAAEEIKLDFAGTGSIDGKDGIIHKGTEGLTTAMNIVKITTVSF